MRRVWQVALLLLLLVVVLGVMAFFLENQQTVTLSFLGWNTVQFPVALPITIALLIGMVISPILRLTFQSGRRRRA